MKAVLKFIKIVVLTAVALIAGFLILGIILTSNNKKAGTKQTPTPEMLIQAKEAAPEQAATEETAAPDFCKDLQLPLTMTADKLDAEGFPHLEVWDPDSRICFYSLRDMKSFLGTDKLGSISFKYTEAEKKQHAMVAVSYKEDDRIREIYKDWSITAISNMIGVDVITAKELFTSASASPMEVYDHYLLLAELNRENLEYRFTITDMDLAEQK